MKILHTADLHIGQILYQNYNRIDEHAYFFEQLETICRNESPDVLIVAGDVFDIQQPSAATWRAFNEAFASLRMSVPKMHIVIIAGNHDSASRLHSHSSVWSLLDTTIIGVPPLLNNRPDKWQEDYIVKLPTGYVITLPYMTTERTDMVQELLDYVSEQNKKEQLPVVMTGHLAVSNCDFTGHEDEIGKLKTISIDHLGRGFDYLALGHIHRPQSMGYEEPADGEEAEYATPVVRYSGSALHVSCDETFPHSVSIIELSRHGNPIKIKPLHINQLRHFYTLPNTKEPLTDAKEAIAAVKGFVKDVAKRKCRGYFRLRLDAKADLPADFNRQVYEIIGDSEARFNPKIIWEGANESDVKEVEKPTFQVAELQQMTDPLLFVKKTLSNYSDLNLTEDELADCFREIEDFMNSGNSDD